MFNKLISVVLLAVVALVLSGCVQTLSGLQDASVAKTRPTNLPQPDAVKQSDSSARFVALQTEISLNDTRTGYLYSSSYDTYVIRNVSPRVRVIIELSGPSNADFDLYVWSDSDRLWLAGCGTDMGCSNSANERVELITSSLTDLWILPLAYYGSGRYKLSVRSVNIPDSIRIRLGDKALSSSLESGRSALYHVEPSSYSLDIAIALKGPSNSDFDLYVVRSTPTSGAPQDRDLDNRGHCARCDAESIRESSNEFLSVNVPRETGLWILIKSWRGSGRYSLVIGVKENLTPTESFLRENYNKIKSNVSLYDLGWAVKAAVGVVSAGAFAYCVVQSGIIASPICLPLAETALELQDQLGILLDAFFTDLVNISFDIYIIKPRAALRTFFGIPMVMIIPSNR